MALEFATVSGPWSVQAEAMLAGVHGQALGALRLTGAYIQASCILSGEHRLYDPSEGIFDSVLPQRNFSWADGTWEAFEVALRLSTLDLDSGALAGGRQRDLTAGLNWYLKPGARLMFNAVHALVNGRSNPPALDGGRVYIFQARLQVEF